MCGTAEIDYTVNFANRSLKTNLQERRTTGPGPCPEVEVLLPINKNPSQITNNLKDRAECVYGKIVDNNHNINWILKNFNDGDKPS